MLYRPADEHVYLWLHFIAPPLEVDVSALELEGVRHPVARYRDHVFALLKMGVLDRVLEDVSVCHQPFAKQGLVAKLVRRVEPMLYSPLQKGVLRLWLFDAVGVHG